MNILIADDHGLFRDGIHHLLQKLGEVSISEAKNLGEIEENLGQSPPLDILLLDLKMPGIDNISVVQRLCDTSPMTAIIIMSGSDDVQTIKSCINAGAMGFIPKSSSSEAMLAGIRLVLSGECYIPAKAYENQQNMVSKNGHGITPRQREIWDVLAEGKSNKEIAYLLGLSESTVKQHLSALFRTLGVNSRIQAIQKHHSTHSTFA